MTNTTILIHTTQDVKEELSKIGGNTKGFRKIYQFFLDNQELFNEQHKQVAVYNPPVAAEMDNYFNCSGCLGDAPISECLMVKWDSLSNSAVGVCKKCRDGMAKSRIHYASAYMERRK